jgi:hypothetical protein
MIEKAPFDLDAALAALGRDEEASRPAVSAGLQARVLAAAAAVAADRGEKALRSARPVRRVPRRRLFGLFDVWGGAAVAAVALCLMIGFALGYQAGPEMAERAGLDGVRLAQVTDDGDATFLWEDVL